MNFMLINLEKEREGTMGWDGRGFLYAYCSIKAKGCLGLLLT